MCKSPVIQSMAKFILDSPLFLFALPIILFLSLLVVIIRFIRRRRKPNLLWGSVPIKSLGLLSRSLKKAGFYSKVVVLIQSPIYSNQWFDYILMPKSNLGKGVNYFFSNVFSYAFFCYSLFKFDIFHYYFDGGILRRTFFKKLEYIILILVGKKIISVPYGSDAFVYDKIPNLLWRHVLASDYPMYGNDVKKIDKRIRFYTRWSTIVMGCLVHAVNLPRWDVLPLTCYPVELDDLVPQWPKLSGIIRIAHAPNHRMIKGTEYLVNAVKLLKSEGFDVALDIIEGVSNNEALVRIQQCDIFVDQLIFGYALAGQEAMALGKVVVSGLEIDSDHYELFKYYSYLSECPIISASIASIYPVLLKLIHARQNWVEIGRRSRAYVEKRHSYSSYSDLFSTIYEKIWDNNTQINLSEYYHPLYEKNGNGESLNKEAALAE